MLNTDMFKMFLDPKLMDKLFKQLKDNPELKEMYEKALKENPDLDTDVDALVRHIFPGEPRNE